MEIKHSIIIICYNQDQYIRVALDSVLCEKVKPYEIIIGDDFSTDQTRNILEEYRIKYPEIIKLVLNESNLGIFENLNNLTPRASGDVMSILSGDDWYKPKLLENMNKKISELNLNPNTLSFILMPHTVIYQQDGSESTLRNDPILLNRYSAVGLIFRNEFQSRHVGLSRVLYNRWPKFDSDFKEIGPWADRVHHVMLAQHIEKFIEMDIDGPVYRVGVGIASQTRSEELNLSFYKALLRIEAHFLNGELKLNAPDWKYLQFLVASWSLYQKFSISKSIEICKTSLQLIKMDFSERRYIARELINILLRIASNYKRKLKQFIFN